MVVRLNHGREVFLRPITTSTRTSCDNSTQLHCTSCTTAQRLFPNTNDYKKHLLQSKFPTMTGLLRHRPITSWLASASPQPTPSILMATSLMNATSTSSPPRSRNLETSNLQPTCYQIQISHLQNIH